MREPITIYYNGQPIFAKNGELLSSTLWKNQIYKLNESYKMKRPRGVYCGFGRCDGCIVLLNGKRVQSCQVTVVEGMALEEDGS
ncbi:(2Fe-2S)-binding protein [Alkalihalobacterium elongatum]|uniref:(2Fe-2S)-binding protein n=1 Tax=Alkalihalobacterium elongatum TaxID=2675466 RepID=UPI001C1FFC4B|nr:(2Fe-2S)-binding protein [Alkalihalobacterium elongatum]